MQLLTPSADYNAIIPFPVICDPSGEGWTFSPEAPYPSANLRALAMLMFHTENNRVPWLALKPGQNLNPSSNRWEHHRWQHAPLFPRLDFFHKGPGRFTDWWQHVKPGDFIHGDPLLQNYYGLRHPTGPAIPVLLTLGLSDCLLDPTTGESILNSKNALEVTCHFLKALNLPLATQQPFKTALKKTKARNIPGIKTPNLLYTKDETLAPIDEITSMVDFIQSNTVLQSNQLLNTSTDSEELLNQLEEALRNNPRKGLHKKIMDVVLSTFQESDALYRPGIWDAELTQRTIENLDRPRDINNINDYPSTPLKKIRNPMPRWTYLREETLEPYREQLENSNNHHEICVKLQFSTGHPAIGFLAAIIYKIETRLGKTPKEIKLLFLTTKNKEGEHHAKEIMDGLIRHYEKADKNEKIWWEKFFIPKFHPNWKMLLAKQCNGPVPDVFLRELVTQII